MLAKVTRLMTILILLTLLAAPVSAGTDLTGNISQKPGTNLSAPQAPVQSISEPVSDGPATPEKSDRLIVELTSPPLVEKMAAQGNLPQGVRPNLNTPAAQSYINQLEAEQAAFISKMQAALPGASVSEYINEQSARVQLTYQVVFNGVTIDPGANDLEAARKALFRLPGVKAVFYDYAHKPDLYASLPLINAPAAWDLVGGIGNAGEGIKAASMDGGIHHSAPMFDGTGYNYPPGFPKGLVANTNGKIIVSRVYFRTWDPPAPGDDTPWPGDSGTSHGVHTSGIMAGNEVVADYLGYTTTISGVAPRAYVMSYRVFYNSITGDGSFYNAEGIAALEDIAMDGADVLNNSWGGGPGSIGGEFDALDQALINTANSGVFISMSAGNAGPGGGTTDHPSNEYINVAASTTSGTLAAGRLDVTAPVPVTDTLKNIPFATAAFGAPIPVGQSFTFDYIPAEVVDPANNLGCNAFPANSLTGKAVLIQRGSCEFGVKVLNGEQAGADFVIVYNHAAGGEGLVSMGPGAVGDQVTISSIFIGHSRGIGMVDWYAQHGAASEFTIDTHAFQAGNTPDIIANFSSRGPGVGMVSKPDITAPGVNILSQGYDPLATGEARHLGYGQASGTSMAAPHVTGAAAMLRQIHPDWSNAYIKSALMTASKYIGIYNDDGSHAQPLDMGAGRLDLTHAADPGIILNPPSLSFGQVVTGTVVSQTVWVTSVATTTETYDLSSQTISATGFTTPTVSSMPGVSINPASITVDAGESVSVTVEIDTAMAPEIGDFQGYILFDGSDHDAHMPVWVRVAPPPTGKVLIIDLDFSPLLGFPDYRAFYTNALTNLGISYDVLNMVAYVGNDPSLPHAAELSAYDTILLFTGDFYYPNGSFTVPSPLTDQDQDRLTEYANAGGTIIAMGQDLASVLNSASTGGGSFFYNSVLGGNWLQDSVTNNAPPTLPIVAMDAAPEAFEGVSLDMSGPSPQVYIDELANKPFKDPDDPGNLASYTPLLRYPGPNNLEDGVTTMAHRDQPTLERPGVSYLGRSIYATFGLEGITDTVGTTSQAELLHHFMSWAMDEPIATITDISTPNATGLSTFEVAVTSTVTSTTGSLYRWDFGDGTAYTPYYASNTAGHVYATCGLFTVRVEVVDSWGNHTVASQEFNITNCSTSVSVPKIYIPFVAKQQ